MSDWLASHSPAETLLPSVSKKGSVHTVAKLCNARTAAAAVEKHLCLQHIIPATALQELS
jgi:hypothetical protein